MCVNVTIYKEFCLYYCIIIIYLLISVSWNKSFIYRCLVERNAKILFFLFTSELINALKDFVFLS